MYEEVIEKMKSSIVDLDRDGAVEAAGEALDRGVPAHRLIEEVRAASHVVGERWEEKEYFISELVIAGAIMKEITDILRPYLAPREVIYKGTVVIGSAPGDLHDIGKNLTTLCLMGAGFRVVDLGVDVPPKRFVEAVVKEDADIIGVSALTSTTMLTMGVVVRELTAAGLRGRVKVIFGGAPMTQEYAAASGADAYATDAITGVRICEEWSEEWIGR
ncbi:MAG: B12-binding domain-containing protein [Candidatus Bathyarchaeia archaeon]